MAASKACALRKLRRAAYQARAARAFASAAVSRELMRVGDRASRATGWTLNLRRPSPAATSDRWNR
jgi:hypothetical protein